MSEWPRGNAVLAEISDPRLRRAAEAAAGRLERDPRVLALGVFGSAVEGRAWDRSDLDLWLILAEDTPRHEAITLLEQGTEVGFQVVSRETLPRLVEKSRGSPLCRTLAGTRWLWQRDPEVERVLERVRSFPTEWRRLRAFEALDRLISLADEGEKLLFLNEPLGALAKLANALSELARIRLIQQGVYPGRDPIGQALTSEPQLIQQYRDLMEGVMPLGDRIEQAVDFLQEAAEPLAPEALEVLRPLLVEGPLSAEELEDHPAFERLHLEWSAPLRWLVSLGLLRQGVRLRPAGVLLAGEMEQVFGLPS